MSVHVSKQLHAVGCKGHGAPGSDQLATINGYALKELSVDEVYVRSMLLAHNAIDRDREVMDDALLRDLARTLPGKGLFIKHPLGYDGDSGPGEGRFFEASITEMSFDEARQLLGEPLQWPTGAETALVLQASFYTVRTDDNKALLAKIDAGVAGDMSIGFKHADRTPITDGSDQRIATRLQAPGEAYEASLVWLGAQPGARINKSATHSEEEDDMDKDKDATIKTLTGDLAAATALANEAETKANENVTKAAALDAIVKAVGRDGMDAKTIGDLAVDGLKYRDSLVDEIVTSKRHLKLVGDSEDDVTSAKDLYAAWPIDALKGEAAGLAKQVPTGSQLDGGDPNASGANEDDAQGKSADVSNPFNNPVVTGKRAA